MSTLEQIRPPVPADAAEPSALLVSVVIPCLNEAENIEQCVRGALAALAGLEGAGRGGRGRQRLRGRLGGARRSRRGAGRARKPARLRQRLPGGLRGFARALHRDGRRRPDVRLRRDPALRGGARGGRGDGDRRPHGQHPAGGDAVAAPLHRQPAADGVLEPAVQHGRQGRALRDARGAPRGARAPGPAHDRHGVRLGDGDPRLEGEACGSRSSRSNTTRAAARASSRASATAGATCASCWCTARRTCSSCRAR